MPDNNLNCMLNIPYPKITESNLNRYDTQMILRLYADELVGIHDYIYYSIVFADTNPELADIFECVSIAEMKHFKLYAKLLYLSGINPGYKTLLPYLKKAGHGTIGKNVSDAIGQLLNAEQTSASNTRLVLSQANDASAVRVLKRIVADEDHHVKILSALMKRYS